MADNATDSHLAGSFIVYLPMESTLNPVGRIDGTLTSQMLCRQISGQGLTC